MSSSPTEQQQDTQQQPQETIASLHATLKQQSAEVYRTTNKIIQLYKQKAMEDIFADRKKMLQEQQQLEEENSKVKKAFVLPEKIELDVGGVFYQTSLSVLRSVPGSFLAVMFSGEYDLQPDAFGRYFLDRNGQLFRYILDYLRDGSVLLPEEGEKRLRIEREAKFFNIKFEEANDEDNQNDDDDDDEATDNDDDDNANADDMEWSFDSKSKHNALTLSMGNTKVTHTGSGHATVIGTTPMSSGVHQWRIKILGAPYWIAIGVCLKANLKTDYSTDYDHMYGCSSNTQLYKATGTLTQWTTNEILTVTLNCDTHTLKIVSKTTNVTATVPSMPLYPLVNLYNNTNCVQLLAADEESSDNE